MSKELIAWFKKEAKEGRNGAHDDMVPVTNDSYICKYEEAILLIKGLELDLRLAKMVIDQKVELLIQCEQALHKAQGLPGEAE